MPFKSLVNDKCQICAEWTLTISQNCSHKWNNQIKTHATLQSAIRQVNYNRLYASKSHLSQNTKTICSKWIYWTSLCFQFRDSISRMKSSTCFLGILLALLQKHAWRVCLYIKNEIQHMLSWNSVGIVAEERLKFLSLHHEWNQSHAFLEFCWHCCRKTLDVLTNIGWQSRMTVSRRICVHVQYELWVIRRDFIAICKSWFMLRKAKIQNFELALLIYSWKCLRRYFPLIKPKQFFQNHWAMGSP